MFGQEYGHPALGAVTKQRQSAAFLLPLRSTLVAPGIAGAIAARIGEAEQLAADDGEGVRNQTGKAPMMAAGTTRELSMGLG